MREMACDAAPLAILSEAFHANAVGKFHEPFDFSTSNATARQGGLAQQIQ
jgi:hypothetical protein